MNNTVFTDISLKHSWLFDGIHKEINTTISPGDGMYKKEQEDYYYICGLWAAQCIRNALRIANTSEASINEILDFASGHGRVTRALNAFFPESNITICDTDKNGVDFISNILNVKGVYGNIDLNKVNFENKFDLIWCGSLFTHIDSCYWDKILNFLTANLNLNGVLVFTTHGRYVANRIFERTKTYGLNENELTDALDGYSNKGFGFGCYDYSNNYGVSISKPFWVMSKIEALNNIEIISFTERGWVKHQDIVACIKSTP